MRAGQAADLLQSSSLPGARQRRCRQVAKWVKQGQLWQASKARIPGFEQKQPCSTPRGMFVAAISAGDLYKPPGMAPGRCFPLFSKLPVGRTNRGGGGEFHPRTKFVWPYPFPGADSLHGCGCNQANPMFPGAPRAVSAIHNLSDPFGADRASSLRKSASPTPPVCPACLLEPQARTSSGGLGKGRQREAWQAVPERVFLFGLSSALQWRPHGWHELQAGHSEARRGF